MSIRGKFLFFVVGPALFIGAGVLAFVTVDGMPIMNMLLSSVGFASGSKNYTWKKKESPYPFKTIKRAPIKKVEEKETVLKTQQSRLKKIHTDVELRTK